MRILAFLLIFLPNIALAWQDWDKQTRDNFWRTSTWIALDWHSTDMTASRGWDGYREKNVIMGPYPSQGEVALYFAARIGLNYWMHDQGLDILAVPVSIIHAHAAFEESLSPFCETGDMHYIDAFGNYYPCCWWADNNKEQGFWTPVNIKGNDITNFENYFNSFNNYLTDYKKCPSVCKKFCRTIKNNKLDMQVPNTQINRSVEKYD